MSSILFVSDYRMIEYHRLYGNQKINFWRPKDQRSINNLMPGDLVFFLARSENKGLMNTKGIVGYGHFVKERGLSFNAMWKEYGDKNGYSDKEQLKAAILEYTSTIPAKIKCLEIDDVTIFNAPIQLEEVGLKDASRLESFMYLDRDGKDYTYKLLQKARDVGLDFWNLEVNSVKKLTMFEEDLAQHRLMNVLNEVGETVYSKTDLNKIKKLSELSIGNDLKPLNHNSDYFYKIDDARIELHIVSPINLKDRSKLKELIGTIEMCCQLSSNEYMLVVHVIDEVSKELCKYLHYDNLRISPIIL